MKDTDIPNQERSVALQKQALANLKTGLFSHPNSVVSNAGDNHKEAQVNKEGRFVYVCSMLWYGMNISANGDVSPCCIDVEYCLKLGNIGEQSILAIYNADKMKNLRDLMLKRALKIILFVCIALFHIKVQM